MCDSVKQSPAVTFTFKAATAHNIRQCWPHLVITILFPRKLFEQGLKDLRDLHGIP